MNGNPGAKELRVMGHTELKQNIHNKYVLHVMNDTNFKKSLINWLSYLICLG